jgi:hypothetical protein
MYLGNIRHLRHLMSSDITVDNGSEPGTVNWMLEDFPADVKQRCKEQAVSQRQTLKAFVETVLREAVGIPQVVNEADPNRKLDETRPSLDGAKPARKSRDKGNIKAKPRAS